MSYMRKQRVDQAATVAKSISDAEWRVMRVVWEKEPVTAKEVVEGLVGKQAWKPKTIHTLLRRLVDKEALGFERNGREYVFRSLIDRGSAELAQSRSFISRIFGSQATAPFLTRFIECEGFTPEEIEDLKRLLDEKQK